MYYYAYAVKYIDESGIIRDKRNTVIDNVSVGVYRAGDTIPAGLTVNIYGDPTMYYYGSTSAMIQIGSYIANSIKITISTYPPLLNTPNITDADRIMNIAHEMGHAWQLEHPKDWYSSFQVVSIMNSGLPSITVPALVAAKPSGYDRAAISTRW